MVQGGAVGRDDGNSDWKGWAMTMQIEQAEPQSYVIYDSIGRPIGRVLQPRHEPAVGPGQETILLVRAG